MQYSLVEYNPLLLLLGWYEPVASAVEMTPKAHTTNLTNSIAEKKNTSTIQ
jgi:hypothetical protein